MTWWAWTLLAIVMFWVLLFFAARHWPWLRNNWIGVGGAVSILVTLIGLLFGRRPRPDDPPTVDPIDPEEYDDEPEQQLDTQADNADAQAAGDGRDLDDLADSNDRLRAELDEL